MSLISELRRRNVFRVAAAYVVVGWLLTEVATTILPMFGAPDWVPRTLVIVLALGFVPVLIFSWAYELTADGLKREKEVDRDRSIARHTGRKLDVITIAAVLIGIVFVGWSRLSPSDARQAAPPGGPADASVAVLPFVNMSGNQDNEYFSDGLTETLLHMLAQVPGLRVAARTSSFAFKGQDRDIRDIAAALGVAHVLEGSVQRAGNTVRITAQLIRASDGFHIWSEHYDKKLTDIFSIQDEIAHTVSDELSASLLGGGDNVIQGIATHDVAAYDLYLKAIAEATKGSYGSLQNSVAILTDALAQDPDFLDARVALANILMAQAETGQVAVEQTLPRVEALTRQVLAARPGDAIARATQLWATISKSGLDGDFDAVRTGIDALQQLVAKATGEVRPRIILAKLQASIHDYDRALQNLQAARELDPLNAEIYYEIGTLQTGNEQYEAAAAAIRKSLEIEPAQPNGYDVLARIAAHTGDAVGVLQNDLKAAELDPADHEIPVLIANFLYSMGLVDEADPFRDRAMAVAPTSAAARLCELQRSIATRDESGSLALARAIIVDDVNNRLGAWYFAAEYLLMTSTRRGEAADVLAFMNETIPGFSDFDATDVPGKVQAVRGAALGAWLATSTREAAMQRAERQLETFAKVGFKLRNSPPAHVMVLALGGDTDAAIDVALSDYFTQSLLAYPDWHFFWEQPMFSAVVADPRVRAELDRWHRSEAGYAEELRAFMASYRREHGA